MADKVRDLLDLSSIRLTAPPVEGAKFPASLSIGVWENKPQFTLRTGVQSLPRYGMFSVSLYPVEFYTVMEGLLEIAAQPFEEGVKVNDSIIVFDKPGNDAREVGEIVWGRDDKGRMFICLVSPDQALPKVVFYVTLPRKFKMKAATAHRESMLHTRGYVSFWKVTMAGYLKDNFVDTSGDRGRGGNGGGGNSNYGGNSGGNNRPTDDDVPF